MSIQEMSDQFDILWNNISSNQGPGLNEYEKSVFLTKAQSQLVKEYFNNRIDSVGGGFDGSQKRQYDFSGLIRTERLYNINTFGHRIDDSDKLDRRSLVFLLPWNYFLSVNEILSDNRWQYSVMPLDYAEYQRLMLKPYNLPVKRGAWRLVTNKIPCKFSHIDEDEDNTKFDKDDYYFLTTWNTKNSITISIKGVDTVTSGITYKDKTFAFITNWTDRTWDKKNYILTVNLEKSSFNAVSDKKVIEFLYDYLNPENHEDDTEWKLRNSTIINLTDGFAMTSAADDQYRFSSDEGVAFTTSTIQVPMIEIIGKFSGNVNYQMRYVRTLSPIILDNLDNYGDDLTIDGYIEKTECALPVECHEEILERAVTLAKIAWQGGTMTQAQAAQREKEK